VFETELDLEGWMLLGWVNHVIVKNVDLSRYIVYHLKGGGS